MGRDDRRSIGLITTGESARAMNRSHDREERESRTHQMYLCARKEDRRPPAILCFAYLSTRSAPYRNYPRTLRHIR